MLKWVLKQISPILSVFFFSKININKILFNFEKEWCTFDNKKGCLKKNKLFIIILKMQKTSRNIINLYQVLNIQTLQVMEPKKEKIQ